MDELQREILLSLGPDKRIISEIEESGIAARQTVHVRIEQLVKDGYLQEEREGKLPFRRYLSLTEKGQQVLELEFSRDRAELDEHAESERDIYKTNWFFRDFVHQDLSPLKIPAKDRVKTIGTTIGTLGVFTLYRDVLRPTFKPNENEKDYAELLMHLFIDSVDYNSLFESNSRLKAFTRLYPKYKRVIAGSAWSLATSFKDQYFDYLSTYNQDVVKRLMKKPFVAMLEKNYLDFLQQECAEAAGESEPIRLDRESFLKVLCWARLKRRNLSFRTYQGLRELLLVIALADLGLIDHAQVKKRIGDGKI
jgi:DNA-binding MarR family transcriptional regulator